MRFADHDPAAICGSSPHPSHTRTPARTLHTHTHTHTPTPPMRSDVHSEMFERGGQQITEAGAPNGHQVWSTWRTSTKARISTSWPSRATRCGGGGSLRHGLSSSKTALITSDLDAMRIHDHLTALITSDCDATSSRRATRTRTRCEDSSQLVIGVRALANIDRAAKTWP